MRKAAPSRSSACQIQNDLNLNIMDIMQADGVDFAFPSTSVYIEKN